MDKLNVSSENAIGVREACTCESHLAEIVERGVIIRRLVDVARECLAEGDTDRADIILRAIWTLTDGTVQHGECALAIVNNKGGPT